MDHLSCKQKSSIVCKQSLTRNEQLTFRLSWLSSAKTDLINKSYYQMKRTLKQPSRYTHSSLLPKDSTLSDEELPNLAPEKHKPIQKETYTRKHINHPYASSAIRNSQINEIFMKISQKAEYFLWRLHLNHELIGRLCLLKEKFECRCGKKVKFYCLQCRRVTNLISLERVMLPLQIRVIHHSFEKISKSSIAPMQLFSSDISFY